MINKKFIILAVTLLIGCLPYLCQASYYEIDNDIKRLMDVDQSKTISLDFKKASLNDVLKIFSQQSGLNFIADSAIADKNVDIYLDKVPVEQALERILAANGLTYELKSGSNIFIVKNIPKPEKEVVTKVYTLKYATLPSSKIKSTYSIDQNETSSSGSSSASSSASSSGGSTDNLAGAKENSDIIMIVKSMLTKDGTVAQDPRTNSIIISDIASQMPIIDAAIAKLDVSVPEVLIEAELLDISKQVSDSLGVNWGNPLVSAGLPSLPNSIRFPFFLTPTANVGQLLQGNEGTLTLGNSVPTTLNLLRSKSDTKSLARPRIITLNNEMAEIKITTQEAIGVSSSTASVTGGSSATTAERYETGVSLKVTPQINLETNEVTMAIRPRVVDTKIDTITDSSDPKNPLTVSFKDPEERGTKSTLRVKDGDTIVLGGLLRKDESVTNNSLPVLSKIPIIGAAFRHKDKKVTDRELVVFLTPHIIRESPQLAKANGYDQLVREQDIPVSRLDNINRDLASIEQLGDQK
ncbi:MAG: type II secretion system protein GspD [Candidatus Omnitrophica bacterium]|nr:type II secretion system protein GspD [Candidatus Omnitrophota bacterium]